MQKFHTGSETLTDISRLEPPGLNRVDGKKPDGVTTVTWKCGKLLVWDATCPAPSYVSQATTAAGEVHSCPGRGEEMLQIQLSSGHP